MRLSKKITLDLTFLGIVFPGQETGLRQDFCKTKTRPPRSEVLIKASQNTMKQIHTPWTSYANLWKLTCKPSKRF
jgi:hypothetical protein